MGVLSRGHKAFRFLGELATYALVSRCIFEHVCDFVLCSGPSMEPTIYTDDILFTEHFTPSFRNVRKGDVVIARCPDKPLELICKRVKGLPGDRIWTGYVSSQVVPRGYVWLEGDNQANSLDSRTYGPVPQGLIRGRAVCKVWPPEAWGTGFETSN